MARSSHGICDRTQEVQDAILNETGGTCSTVTPSQLAGVQYLYTDGYSSTTVVPGDFANLTGLIELGIWDSSELTTVPANAYSEVIGNSGLINVSLVRNAIADVHIDAFDGLSGIGTLDLRFNLIETLEPGVFKGVSALTILDLRNNHIQNLEDGLFDDLTGLIHLDLTNNGLKRLDNAVIGGLSQLEILYLGDNELSNLEANTFNGLSSLQQLIVSGNGLSNLPAGIFDGLAELQQLYLDANFITDLDPSLFAPLDDSLGTLRLSYNRLEALPADIFDGLTGLRELSLNGNDISSLDAGVFGALTGLTSLALNDNSLSTLPATVFDGLENLHTLLLNDNSLSTLDADIFDPLDDSLLYLYLNDNSLSTLDADIFDGLTGLQYLILNDNSLSTLDADLFDPLDDSLLLLYLNDNRLSTLDADIFDGLTGLLRVYLNDNSLSTLDANIFDGLAGLQRLYLNHNSLSSLPALIFEDLDDSLQQLVLTDNSISTLPAMVFAGLTGLQGLDLSCNGLTALDLTLFDPFASSLTYLDVSGNSYGSTPTETTLRDKFDQITATSGSLYTGSNSECLPPYEFGLNGLSLSTGTLLPAFQAPGETVYTARVGRGVSSIDVAVTTSDPRATIEPRHNPFGTFLTPGLQLNLTHVRSDIGWQVRVRNGSFAVPYQIVVYRDQPLATNALLRSLELSGITLGKDFSGRTDTYTATAYVAETTVTATPLDPDATTVIRNNGVVDSDGTVSLAVGANTITVEVTAEDGVTKRTYTVDVTRTTAEYLATLPAPRLPTDDNRNAIWLATLTVADLGSNQYGYDGAPGGLTDTAFTYLGDDTPIPENQAFRLVGTLYTIDSSYFSAGQFHFSLDSAFVDDDADNIFVVVDGTRLKFSDASFDSSTNTYGWAMSNPSWTAGDEVTVKIVVLQEDDGPEDLAPTTTENGDEYDVTLTWSVPTTGGTVTGYRVEYQPDPALQWKTLETNQSGTTYTQSGLARGAVHFYRVAALRSGSAARYSAVVRVQAASETQEIPAKVNYLLAGPAAGSDTALKLAWNRARTPSSRAPATGYQVQYALDDGRYPAQRDGVDFITVTLPRWVNGLSWRTWSGTIEEIDFEERTQRSPALKTVVTGLAPGTEYRVRVRGCTDAGCGEWSNPRPAETSGAS